MFDRIIDGLKLVSRILGFIGLTLSCISIVGIVVLLSSSALLRYFARAPLPFTEELAGLLFVIIFTAAVVHATNENRHLRLVVLWQKLPKRWQAPAMIAGDLMALLVMGIICKVTWDFAMLSRMFASRTVFGDLLLWPWMMTIPVSLACFGFALLVRMLDVLRSAIRGEAVITESVSFH